jgi:ribosome recycling factor
MVNEVTEELKNDMVKTVERLAAELSRVRTGRANLALLDGIKVDYYGVPTPLNQVASLQLADARLIVVKPWEKTMVSAVEKAIQQSDLGLNPNSDGEIIRLPVPPLTEERRKEIVKTIKRLGEDYKVKLRGLRRDANEMLKALEKDKEISEDENPGAGDHRRAHQAGGHGHRQEGAGGDGGLIRVAGAPSSPTRGSRARAAPSQSAGSRRAT